MSVECVPKKLWVDDVRVPPEPASEWLWMKNYLDAANALEAYDFDIVSLDHDLGDDSLNGYHLACLIELRASRGERVPDDIRVHSANPVGRKNIELCIEAIQRFKNS
ncbi:MAG TPA: cyclic-phosphate processing receiver domain-containing protein [Dongiaceae bacterium]|nr:cyclic-phosphate processing receiver domain-containing protein [Dongiaceae bacterium]